MPVLVDGNNLLHRMSRSRDEVRSLNLELARHEGVRIIVVFDGPPPAGSPDRESLGRVSIVYSGGEAADEVIVRTIPDGRRARDWVVVTDDRRLVERCRGRGARRRPLSSWIEKLRSAPGSVEPDRERKLTADELAEWEAYFAAGGGEGQ